jgi:predicted ester cyclase
MSAETNKKIVLHWVREGVNKHDLAMFDDVLHPDVVDHVGGQVGIEWWRFMGGKLRASFPDLEFVIDDVIAAEDKVVLRLTMTGTHRGSDMPMLIGMEPTGKAVSWSHIHIFRVTDGKIAEHWAVRDDPSMLKQLAA